MTESELLEELYLAMADAGPDDAFTTEDLSMELGLGLVATRRRIKAAVRAGKVAACKIVRENMAGQMQRVVAYRVLPNGDGSLE